MERTILISNDIRPFNFQAVRTAITKNKKHGNKSMEEEGDSDE